MKKTIACSAMGAAALLSRLGSDLTRATVAAERENAQDARGELVAASHGSNSTADLRRAGHPYAKRAPNPAYDPSVVNDQGHGFPEGWAAGEPIADETGETITSAVVNHHPDAHWIATAGEGGSRQVARPIVQRAAAAVRERRKRRVRAGVQQFINKAARGR